MLVILIVIVLLLLYRIFALISRKKEICPACMKILLKCDVRVVGYYVCIMCSA